MSPRRLSRWLLLVLLAASVGCGTVCDDASAICGLEIANQPEECTGTTECAALCIVDWEACNVNEPTAPESECITACVEAAKGS